MSKLFQRTIETFTCENCGIEVQGDGYTNHCPACLWSKHVDINPGDRAESCQGGMKPIEIIVRGTEYTIIHQCQKCGLEKRVRSSKADNFEALITIANLRGR